MDEIKKLLDKVNEEIVSIKDSQAKMVKAFDEKIKSIKDKGDHKEKDIKDAEDNKNKQKKDIKDSTLDKEKFEQEILDRASSMAKDLASERVFVLDKAKGFLDGKTFLEMKDKSNEEIINKVLAIEKPKDYFKDAEARIAFKMLERKEIADNKINLEMLDNASKWKELNSFKG